MLGAHEPLTPPPVTFAPCGVLEHLVRLQMLITCSAFQETHLQQKEKEWVKVTFNVYYFMET